MTYKEHIDNMKAKWTGETVYYQEAPHKVLDVDYNGCLLVDCPAKFTDTTAISETQAKHNKLAHDLVIYSDIIEMTDSVYKGEPHRHYTLNHDGETILIGMISGNAVVVINQTTNTCLLTGLKIEGA